MSQHALSRHAYHAMHSMSQCIPRDALSWHRTCNGLRHRCVCVWFVRACVSVCVCVHDRVTVDAQRLGRREADERNRFALPPHLQLRNLEYLSRDKTAQARDSQVSEGRSMHCSMCPYFCDLLLGYEAGSTAMKTAKRWPALTKKTPCMCTCVHTDWFRPHSTIRQGGR